MFVVAVPPLLEGVALALFVAVLLPPPLLLSPRPLKRDTTNIRVQIIPIKANTQKAIMKIVSIIVFCVFCVVPTRVALHVC